MRQASGVAAGDVGHAGIFGPGDGIGVERMDSYLQLEHLVEDVALLVVAHGAEDDGPAAVYRVVLQHLELVGAHLLVDGGGGADGQLGAAHVAPVGKGVYVVDQHGVALPACLVDRQGVVGIDYAVSVAVEDGIVEYGVDSGGNLCIICGILAGRQGKDAAQEEQEGYEKG